MSCFTRVFQFFSLNWESDDRTTQPGTRARDRVKGEAEEASARVIDPTDPNGRLIDRSMSPRDSRPPPPLPSSGTERRLVSCRKLCRSRFPLNTRVKFFRSVPVTLQSEVNRCEKEGRRECSSVCLCVCVRVSLVSVWCVSSPCVREKEVNLGFCVSVFSCVEHRLNSKENVGEDVCRSRGGGRRHASTEPHAARTDGHHHPLAHAHGHAGHWRVRLCCWMLH